MLRLPSPVRPILAGLLIALVSVSAAAAQAVNLDRSGLALSGYDAVAYQTEDVARKGSPEFTATYEGGTYRFATAANRDAFLARPDKFVAAYGGYCAYGVSQGHKVSVDPEAFRLVDGKLYLNYSKSVQQQWLKDVPGFIAKANTNWPGLQNKPRD
jgi:YHS domain-containing protein